MRLPRFTILQLLLAATLVALLLGLFTSARRVQTLDEICQFCFSPNGKLLAARYQSGVVRVWRLDQDRPRLAAQIFGVPQRPAEWNQYLAEGMCFVNDYRLLKLDGGLGTMSASPVRVRELDVTTGRVSEVLRINVPNASQRIIAATASHLYLAEWGTSNVLCFDLGERELERQFAVGIEDICSLAISSDGSTLVLCDGKDTLNVVDAKTGRIINTFSNVSWQMNSMALSPDGSRLIATVRNRPGGKLTPNLAFFDTRGGGLPDLWPTSLKGEVIWTATSKDGQRLAVCDQLEGTEFYDVKTKKLLWKITHDELVAASAATAPSHLGHFELTSDGEKFVVASGGQIMFWDIVTGKLQQTIGRNESRTAPVAIFSLGFALWAAAWGIVRKRMRLRDAMVTRRSEPIPVAEKTILPTPIGMKICWGMMVAGGLVAVAMPIVLMFTVRQWLFPTTYVSLFIGLAAIARGAACDSVKLKHTAGLQLLNLLVLDVTNFIFAIMEIALLRSSRVQEYLKAVNR